MTMTAIFPEISSFGIERLSQLNDLTPDQVEAGLAWLAGFAPAAFDSAIEIARTWDASPTPPLEMEPYCAACSAPVGIFTADGDEWRHYRGEGPKFERYDQGHAPVIGWRPAR
jgi:hypothetical protein